MYATVAISATMTTPAPMRRPRDKRDVPAAGTTPEALAGNGTAAADALSPGAPRTEAADADTTCATPGPGRDATYPPDCGSGTAASTGREAAIRVDDSVSRFRRCRS